MPLFTRKEAITVADLAELLVGMVEDERVQAAELEALEPALSLHTDVGIEIDERRLRWELFYLRAFAVGSAADGVLSNEQLNDAYAALLRKHLAAADPSGSAVDELGQRVALYERQLLLGQAVARIEAGNPVLAVALAFGKCCGLRGGLLTQTIVAIYAGAQVGAAGLLERVRLST